MSAPVYIPRKKRRRPEASQSKPNKAAVPVAALLEEEEQQEEEQNPLLSFKSIESPLPSSTSIATAKSQEPPPTLARRWGPRLRPSSAVAVDSPQQTQLEETCTDSHKHTNPNDDSTSIRASPLEPLKNKQESFQKPEDYMDDRDHNDWGGPVKLKHASIGAQLLRQLGWRPNIDNTYTVYLPGTSARQTHDTFTESILSKRRLKKLVQQQNRVRIPDPHFSSGLGFQKLQDAPEFANFASQRQRAAQHRSHLTANVYRLSDAMGAANDNSSTTRPQAVDDTTNVAFETVEDFVGAKSSTGFALRDDHDDTYDDQGNQKSILSVFGDQTATSKVDKSSYESHVYEHEDSDVEDDAPTASLGLGAALSSFAATDTNADELFCVGSENNTGTVFRGPNIPHNYEPRPHAFAPNEHPNIFRALARAEQLQVVEKRQEQNMRKIVQKATIKPFAGVRAAMNNRFATATTENAVETLNPVPRMQTEDRAYRIDRTMLSFRPEALLCKRLGLKKPKEGVATVVDKRTRDDAYFEDEILKVAKKQVEDLQAQGDGDEASEAGNDSAEPEVARPPLEVYRSIFADAVNDSSSENEEQIELAKDGEQEDLIDDVKVAGTDAPGTGGGGRTAEFSIQDIEPQIGPTEVGTASSRNGMARKRSPSTSSCSSLSRKRRKKDKKKRKKDKKKKKRKKSRHSDYE